MNRNISLIIAAVCLTFLTANGQCPPAKAPSIHVVQKGETLYSISRKYKIPVQDIARWNNMALNDVLFVCKELKVSATATTNTSAPPSPPTGSAADKQLGGQHIVKPGEKIAGIAKAYGFAEWRFRKINNLTSSQEVSPGVSLKTEDCNCPPLAQEGTLQFYDAEQPAITGGNTTTRPGEEAVLAKQQEPVLPDSTSTPTIPGPPKLTAAFMAPAELAMADEINLLRSNPAAYIPFIEERKAEIKAGSAFGSVETADELINELKNSPPLSLLTPLQCLYNAAKKHGEDERSKGISTHVGADGSWPWERARRECPTLADGNENLVGGLDEVRDAVIMLLLDEGIPTRGHRRVLLNPDWKYVAVCYVGQIGTMPNNWIQMFGK